MKRNCLLILLVLTALPSCLLKAQVSISSTATTPDASAMLDVKSNSKGILIPRTSTVSRVAIVNPAKGLMVYDTTTSSFWFHNGIAWNEVTVNSNVWAVNGNSSTNPAINYLGTSDSQPLNIKVHSLPAGKIDEASANSFWGLNAGGLSTGKQNTAMGYFALRGNTTGTNNVAIGNKALSTYAGSFNTAVGDSAMANTTNTFGDSYNTAIGSRALASNTVGNSTTALGESALFSNTSGNLNTATGYRSLFSNTAGSSNTATGSSALYQNISSFNTANGANALFSNTSGSFNIAIGPSALYKNNIGSSNIAIGSYALYNSVEIDHNIAIGDSSMFGNTFGSSNVAIGHYTLKNNTNGYSNCAVGNSSLMNNTTGIGNSAFGDDALGNTTIGGLNTAVGPNAIGQNVSGNNNAGIGYAALFTNITGSNNTALGYQADIRTDGQSFSTAIGSNAVVNCSNCLVLGGSTITSHTRVGINNRTPTSDLHIIQQSNADLDNSRGIELQQSGAGNQWRMFIDPSNNYILQFNNGIYGYVDPVGASFHNFSDARLKKDIRSLDNVLDRVLQLKAVTYHYNKNNDSDPRLYGFVAQDVEKLFPEFVSTAGNGYKGIAYNNFSVVAIQAIKEQQQVINELRSRVEALERSLKRSHD